MCAVLAAIGAIAVLPHEIRLDPGVSGDRTLAGQARAAVGDRGRSGFSVATVDGRGQRLAGVGTADGDPVTARTRFRTASVAKTFTGMLFADAVRRGELRFDTTLGDVYGDRVRGGLRGVTLTELGSHRSGLPSLWPGTLRRTAAFFGGSIFGAATPAELLASAQQAPLGPQGRYVYSNLGMSLLGNAVAERAHTDYPTLLRNRLLEPLGMRDTGLRVGVGGYDQLGRPVADTDPGAFAPAGPGMYSSARDLAVFLRAVLRGTAPGMAATEPRADALGTDRTGLDWITSRFGARSLLWHSGGDAGAGTFVGVSGRRGVVLLGNAGRDVSSAAMRMLDLDPPASLAPIDPPPASGSFLIAELVLLGVAAFAPLWTVRRGRDRAGTVVAVLAGLAILALVWSLAPWAASWTWALWVLAAGAVGAAIGIAVTTKTPWWQGKPLLRAPFLVLITLASAAAIALNTTAWL